MKNLNTQKETLQWNALDLTKYEYENLIAYRQSDEYKIAKQCGIDNIEETVWFIQRLLSKCFPFEDDRIGIEIKAFAEKAEKNGDFWLTLFIVSQIEFENRIAMREIKNWAKNKLKVLIQ